MASLFVLEPDEVQELCAKEGGISVEDFVRSRVAVVARVAICPVSHFFVGAAAIGLSGRVYFGVNVEFPGLALNESIHGEQFLLCNVARLGLDTQLSAIIVNAAPCGHCRQFMTELNESDKIRICFRTVPTDPASVVERSLADILPFAFTPADLGCSQRLLAHRGVSIRPGSLRAPAQLTKSETDGRMPSNELLALAVERAHYSHSPYTKCPSACALRTRKGVMVAGEYIESAAYNPSMSPMHVAIVALLAEGIPLTDVVEAVLVELDDVPVQHWETVLRILKKSVNYHIALHRIPLEQTGTLQ